MRVTITSARLAAAAATLLLAGCGEQQTDLANDGADYADVEVNERAAPAPQPMTVGEDPGGEPEVGESPWVETTLINREGEEIGNLSIEPVAEGVRLALHVEGLAPGPHAVHFHEHGRCEPPDFKSAGDHFDPSGSQHGFPDMDEDYDDPDHHAGDMLNQKVNDQELLSAVFVNQTVSLSRGQPNSLVEGDGTALVIHAKADDFESQPAGDAGDRVACAPITGSTTVGSR